MNWNTFPRLHREPSTMLLVASVAMGANEVYSGIQAKKAAKANASLQEEQAQIVRDEANRAAEQKGDERRKFLAQQRMAYLASGVSLLGTPTIVGEETYNEFQKEIDAIRKAGSAQYQLGMRKADITRSTGRAQLTSGILSGVGTVGTGYYKSTL